MTNELDPRLMGVASTNPFDQHISASRKQMYHTHLGQALLTTGLTRRRIQSGMEREYGEYTFDIRMPCDAEIKKIIHQYSPRHTQGQIKDNPETLVLYRDYDTGEYGCVSITKNHIIDKDFGFDYILTDDGLKLTAGTFVKKDTILARSPAVTEDGDYMLGRQSQVAFMSVPAVIEDGVVASKAFCENNKIKAYGKRHLTWGQSGYPLNLYGHTSKDGQYRPFPNIGDEIREDGLLFARRTYDEFLAPVEMTEEALKQPDYVYDHLIYGIPGARIVDVQVHRSYKGHPKTPVGMEEQVQMYVDENTTYQRELTEFYKTMQRESKSPCPKISPELNRRLFLCEQNPALNPEASEVSLRAKTNKLDEWYVTITFEYMLTPTVGFKLTGTSGNKGVICDVWPEEDMPVDQWGTRAELIFDGLSTVKRMNPAHLYEHYYTASADTLATKIRSEFLSQPEQCMVGAVNDPGEMSEIVHRADPETVKMCYEVVKDFISTISPWQHDAMVEMEESLGVEFIKETIAQVLYDGIYLWVPVNSPKPNAQVVRELREKYPPNIGPVQYRGASGNMVTTVKDVLISSLYVLMLNKVGSSWQAVASSKLQHYGVLAKLTNADKYSSPGRQQPVRILGEAEVRLLSAVLGADVVADLLDQSGNPRTHKAIVEKILSSPKPTNIKKIINRKDHPLGHSRALEYTNHILECGGIELFRPE